jgi:hypothetical protein
MPHMMPEPTAVFGPAAKVCVSVAQGWALGDRDEALRRHRLQEKSQSHEPQGGTEPQALAFRNSAPPPAFTTGYVRAATHSGLPDCRPS